MEHSQDLARLDAEWDAIPLPFLPENGLLRGFDGAFGHARERRLGLRVPANCWCLVRGRARSIYAQAIELSVTGVVLKFAGPGSLVFRPGQMFGLDLFVPGASSTVHAAMRSVRTTDGFNAFEFVEISPVDRLTLAEYIDRLIA